MKGRGRTCFLFGADLLPAGGRGLYLTLQPYPYLTFTLPEPNLYLTFTLTLPSPYLCLTSTLPLPYLHLIFILCLPYLYLTFTLPYHIFSGPPTKVPPSWEAILRIL